MPTLISQIPASVRQPVEPSRFTQGLLNRFQAQVLVAGPEARATALSKSRFARMPQEPEDARMTGVTRSLQRRLLALNVQGSLVPSYKVSGDRSVLDIKIA